MLSYILSLYCLLFSFSGYQVQPNDIAGTWYCEAMDKSVFEVTRDQSGAYRAVITSSDNKSYVGKKVMKNTVFIPDKNMWEGELISPSRGMDIDAKFTLLSPSRLKVVGKVLFMKKTYVWVRK